MRMAFMYCACPKIVRGRWSFLVPMRFLCMYCYVDAGNSGPGSVMFQRDDRVGRVFYAKVNTVLVHFEAHHITPFALLNCNGPIIFPAI